ncbi:MAG: DUF3035 domain-containing protein [Magnetococcales bacterium]|nr:DUF3035 domain-containing protein [Magnetococcales bacterium]
MKPMAYLSCLAMALMLAGCSGKFHLPWDSDLPDINRIATREPLEIPPDLDLLPPLPGSRSESADTLPGSGGGSQTGGAVAQAGIGTGASPAVDVPPTAANILFGTKVAKKVDPVSRDQKEKLPVWMK